MTHQAAVNPVPAMMSATDAAALLLGRHGCRCPEVRTYACRQTRHPRNARAIYHTRVPYIIRAVTMN